MHELWSSASYEPHLLSLLFALAPAAMLIVIAFAAVMRGAPILRGFLLGHAFLLHQQALRPLDRLARGERLGQRLRLLAERGELLVTCARARARG